VWKLCVKGGCVEGGGVDSVAMSWKSETFPCGEGGGRVLGRTRFSPFATVKMQVQISRRFYKNNAGVRKMTFLEHC
jgi:hypothetical protein